MLENVLRSGAALSRLKAMIKAQGGDSNVCDDLSLLPQPAFRRTVRCGVSGYVQAMDTMALGLAAQAMGAGRIRKSDKLDYSVGFILPVRIGDYVTPDQTLCTLLAKSAEDADRAEAAIRAAITIGVEKPTLPPLCYAIVTRDGVQRMDA